jgi:hypothetical protein
MTGVEVHPRQCPNGHALKPGNVLVGWLPCICRKDPSDGYGHRSVQCLTCKTTWYNPPHDGRDWIPDDELRGPSVR